MGAATALVVLLGLLSIGSQAKTVTSPLKVRFNSDLIRDIFYKSDQDILNIFANISLGELDLQNGLLVREANVSLIPKSGDMKQFNYDLSLDETKFLGVDTKDLVYRGRGEILQGETVHEFEIEGPVSQFRFLYDVKKNVTGTGHEVNFKAFEFSLDPAQMQIKAEGDAAAVVEGKVEDIKKWIHAELQRMVNQIKDDTMSGAIFYVSKLPLLNITPLVTLYHIASLAEEVNFANDFIEYGFTPVSMRMVNKRNIPTDL
jgi:hypothetical protein